MKFSYNWLKEFVPKLPKADKLAEFLNLHAFEVEGVDPIRADAYRGRAASNGAGKKVVDYVLDVAILPNRIADASGHIGLAREVGAILNVPVKVPKAVCKESAKKVKDALRVEIATELCGRYVARVIKGVAIKESPQWLRERLEVCGLKAINNVVDATNYTMLETGQPLHAFDYSKIGGKKILVRSAKAGERITALDGAVYELSESMTVIADGADPLAIAGVKGGTKAEVDAATKDIVLEAARFDGPTTRKASGALGLRTDASIRFSVGLDSNAAGEAMERLCALIEKIAGGVALKGNVDVYPKKRLPVKIALRPEYVNSLLGTALKESEMASFLKRLGCEVKSGKKEMIITTPTRRPDLQIEEDLIEEIGRIHGFENIEPVRPLGELVPPEVNNELFFIEKARDLLAGLGFREVYNYSFAAEGHLELENPTRPEFSHMRSSLAPGLLTNAAENLKHTDAVRMFEIGHVFLPEEKKYIGGFIAYKAKSKEADAFFELKGALSSLFEGLGLSLQFGHSTAPDLTLEVEGKALGTMKEIHGIKGEAALFEMDADVLAELTNTEKEFEPISKYPSVMRDIALLVPFKTRVVEVMDIIENTGGELLVDTDLFDIYEGREIVDGKKNFAFRLVFQAKDRTLRDEEVDAVVERITKTLEVADPEWEVRK